jgi:hypothetical protein
MISGILLVTALAGICWWVIVYRDQKIKRIQSSAVLEVDGADDRYPGLPLGRLGIFWSANRTRRRIRVVFPKLTAEGDVQYIYSWHDLRSVYIPVLDETDAQSKAKLGAAQELATFIEEHLQLEPEIANLRKQWHKISDLLALVATSDLYASQQDTYERALLQVEDLLNKAEQLEQVYIYAIREALIGREIAGYTPDLLPDSNSILDNQYAKIKEEYQTMKDTATAYAELLRTRQV